MTSFSIRLLISGPSTRQHKRRPRPGPPAPRRPRAPPATPPPWLRPAPTRPRGLRAARAAAQSQARSPRWQPRRIHQPGRQEWRPEHRRRSDPGPQSAQPSKGSGRQTAAPGPAGQACAPCVTRTGSPPWRQAQQVPQQGEPQRRQGQGRQGQGQRQRQQGRRGRRRIEQRRTQRYRDAHGKQPVRGQQPRSVVKQRTSCAPWTRPSQVPRPQSWPWRRGMRPCPPSAQISSSVTVTCARNEPHNRPAWRTVRPSHPGAHHAQEPSTCCPASRRAWLSPSERPIAWVRHTEGVRQHTDSNRRAARFGICRPSRTLPSACAGPRRAGGRGRSGRRRRRSATTPGCT
eukprot:m.213806 g.213806  ORF g.213806 m.213806 type:complete len:345 (-) comp10142_c0_seq69:2043-3077(-)